MPKQPSLFSSVVNCKCPRCRTGKVFKGSVLNPFEFSKTNDNCPHCGLKFEHETGFFWAAMYISYGFSTAVMIIFGVIAINADWSFKKILYILIPIVLVLTPFLFRYSRILLLYIFSPNRHFDKEYL
ncbi:MAG: DUF983 domain-containing protein [Bacteroidota bacterium]|nr:DUF983 domain-containing protein [Bacteroidota bacterium]